MPSIAVTAAQQNAGAAAPTAGVASASVVALRKESIPMKSWFRANYLDASAVVKILVEEDDSLPVNEYFHKGGSCFHITSVCFAEALGVLKVKHFARKEITGKGYLNRAYRLAGWLRTGRIVVDEVDFSDPKIFDEVESVVKTYGIDISDAFQIVTIKRGAYSTCSGESQSLLITADKGLAKAARDEGIKVWLCLNGPVP